MDTEITDLRKKNYSKLTQIIKTLKPVSSPIHSNFYAKSDSSSQLLKQMADHHLSQVSDVAISNISDDHTQFPPYHKTLKSKRRDAGSLAKFDAIDVDDLDLGVLGNAQRKNRVKSSVIELKDDDFDCVFVKKERNLLPRGGVKKDPICVDEYVKSEKKVSIDVDKVVHCVDDDDDDEVRIVDVIPFFKMSSDFVGISSVELGETSGSKRKDESSRPKRRRNSEIVIEIEDDPEPKEVMFLCEICADSKPKKESFRIKDCSHSYCSDCIKSYVASKLQDVVSKIDCPVPGCAGVLEPEYCREILPFEVFDRWNKILCESAILASQKFYCPFKDCSALLIADADEIVTQSECPTCFRLFCAQCKVGWHDSMKCAEFQALGKDERERDDLMLKKLAKQKNWQRCPKCKFFVEKSEGCLYMKCRCGIAFCYSCGAINNDHRYHYCKKCGR